MKNKIVQLVLIFYTAFALGQNDSETVPFSDLFYNFGENTLHSLTYNYGVNYMLSGLGTYYMVHSGLDWEWRNIAANNKALAYSGMPFGLLGFVLPVTMPLGMYVYGRHSDRADYQVTGLALGQAAMLGLLVSSSMKAFTGRQNPEILAEANDGTKNGGDFSDDFAWGFMRRGVFHGWPSGHTMVIFAMAVTLAELYPENLPLRITAYSYAVLTGAGMSLFVHWASDAVAGGLIGYCIGKSVGGSYKKLLDKYTGAGNTTEAAMSGGGYLPGINITKNVSFYILPNGAGINVFY